MANPPPPPNLGDALGKASIVYNFIIRKQYIKIKKKLVSIYHGREGVGRDCNQL